MFSTTIVRHGFRASLGVLAAAMTFGLASPMPASPTQAVQLVATTGSPDAGFAAKPHDPNTCKSPWVWRMARPTDRVCVTVETRRDTELENRSALSRQIASGNNTCKSPFVWRDAYSGDKTCVPLESRSRAFKDNAAAAERRASKCDKFALPNEGISKFVLVHEDATGLGHTTVTIPVAYDDETVESQRTATYRFLHDRATTYGTAIGRITGRNISITVNWTKGPGAGWVNTYTGQMEDRTGDHGYSSGTVRNLQGKTFKWHGAFLHKCRHAPVK